MGRTSGEPRRLALSDRDLGGPGSALLMKLGMLFVIGLAASSLVLAADEQEVRGRIQGTGMERVPFPTGGLLHLKNATGDVSVEGCDCQEAEIATIKYAK